MPLPPEQHGERIQKAVRRGLERAPHGITTIIAIDGPGGGAGKSTLAMYLADWLGGVPVIHTDDFASYEQILNWQNDFIREVAKPLREDKNVRYKKYDWESRRKYGNVSTPAGGTVILEGNGSMMMILDPYIDFKIWVDAPANVRLGRALDRDGHDERTKKKWRRWMKEWDNYVANEKPQLRADLIVDGTKPYATNFRGSND